jgi:hypothetical protein
MNSEDFEHALRRDLAAVPRHDPTAAWKADILARALAKPMARIITFPHLMLGAWAACWAVALVLRFLTPSSADSLQVAHSNASPSPSADADWRTLENHRNAMRALLASNDSSNLTHP